MSDTLQEGLVSTAVTGLSQSADLDALIPADLTNTFARDNFRSDADRFLQLLTLQQLEHSVARLPASAENMEPLPAEPKTLLNATDPTCLTVFTRLNNGQHYTDTQALLSCMLNTGHALPDTFAIAVFAGSERGLQDLCGLGASARLRWMLSLLPDWSALLSTSATDWIEPAQQLLSTPDRALSDETQDSLIQTFNDCRPNLRGWLTRMLARKPAADVARFVRSAWHSARAEGRTMLVHLLAGISDWLLSPEGRESFDWLHALPNERATSVRQLLSLLKSTLAQREAPHGEYCSALKQALSACIAVSKQGTFDLQAPEALSPELIALGVADVRNHADLDISKPAARLGQLIRLGGPSIWAQLLDTSVENACQQLLDSRYCKELLPFMQDSLFWHRQLHLLPMLYRAANQPKRFHLEHFLARLAADHVLNQPHAASALLGCLDRHNFWQLLRLERICLALLLADVELTPEASQRCWKELQPLLLDHEYPGNCASLLLNLTDEQLNQPPEHRSKLTEDQQILYREHCQRIGTAIAFRQSLKHRQASTSQGEHP